MPAATTPLKIVLEHVTGPLAGLSQIVNRTDEEGMEACLPLVTYIEPGMMPFEGTQGASMVRQRRGAIYYREIVKPEGLGTFSKAQR